MFRLLEKHVLNDTFLLAPASILHKPSWFWVCNLSRPSRINHITVVFKLSSYISLKVSAFFDLNGTDPLCLHVSDLQSTESPCSYILCPKYWVCGTSS